MLAVAVIVFREVLEAALIIGVVMAASLGVPGRGRWISGGVGAGVAGSLLIALGAASIAQAFSGFGQEILNAAILLVAVGMLAWHNLWMARHGAEMAARARGVSRQIADGTRPLYALAVITAAASLREGAETVLFVAGIAGAGQESLPSLAAGVLIGLAAGSAMGVLLYAGLLRIPVHRLFRVTAWMVLLLACGLAAQAAGLLNQADILPAFGDQVWDTSALLSEDSIVGKVAHSLVGYVARPAGVQVIAWLLTLLAIGLPMRRSARAARPARAPLAALMVGLSVGLAALPARADLQVRYPTVEEGEFEFEHNGLLTIDSRKNGQNGAQSYTGSIGYGFTSWWKMELEAEFAAGGGQPAAMNAGTIENTFQLTPQGKYFVDVGFFAEYSQTRGRHNPNEFVFGPIFQKQIDDVLGVDTLHTLNLFFGKEVGPRASGATSLDIAWQSRLLLNPYIDPAVEYYGTIENLGRAGRFATQEHFLGPAIVGGAPLGPGKVKYELGYMFGISQAAAQGGIRWKLEYEFVF